VGRYGYSEDFHQLCRYPILDGGRVKNPVTASTFEFLLNFKRGLILPKKSNKFSQKSVLT
jgi:hypothetical protein